MSRFSGIVSGLSSDSGLFQVTPAAAKGLIALAFIGGLFGLDRLSGVVAETKVDVEQLQGQMDELDRVANAPDPTALLEQTDVRIAAVEERFLNESTSGLNAARLQMALKQALDACEATRSLISVEPQDQDAGESLRPFIATLRFRAPKANLPDCLAGMNAASQFVAVDTMTWQRTGTVVMNVRAFAVVPDDQEQGS